MSNNTIIQTGSFTSTGAAVTLNLRSGTNFLSVYNTTQVIAQNANTGYQFYWQQGMTGFEYQSNAGHTAVNIVAAAAGSFTLVDTSVNTPIAGAAAITAGTNAVQPVYAVANTTGVSVGTVVRLANLVGQPNLAGYDFTVGAVTANTSFTIAATLANAPGAAATAGNFFIIPYNPLFYPSARRIVNITQAVNAVVTTSVNHNYIVGQSVRLNVPAVFGMVQADQLLVNITAVTATTFTTDLNSTAFSAFVFPLAAAYPFTPARCVPVGEETDANSNPNLLDDATVNTGIIGITLAPGINGPAGQNNDVIYWSAGRSFNF